MTRLPFLHQTPAEALQQVIQRRVQLQGQCLESQCFEPKCFEPKCFEPKCFEPKCFEPKCFEITYPGNPDALLDHPATHAAFHQDEYMPYWADLWPSAQMLGEALLRGRQEVSGHPSGPWRSLEIGCGVGLPGIVALALGLHVVFSDYDRAALGFAERNAIANGFEPGGGPGQFELLPLDWRSPPANLQVDLLLASDVIYEQRNLEPLIALIKTVLLPGGSCWLADPNRPLKSEFEMALKSNDLNFSQTAIQLDQIDSKTVHGTLFKIQA